MTNLNQTLNIWNNTMGENMPGVLETILKQKKKSYQTVETLLKITENRIYDELLYGFGGEGYGFYWATTENNGLTVYQRAERDAKVIYKTLKEFETALNLNIKTYPATLEGLKAMCKGEGEN